MRVRLMTPKKRKGQDNTSLYKRISSIEWKLDKLMKYLNLK